MMKKIVLVLTSLLLMTGCWDERELKNVKLVLTMGYDVSENGDLIETVSIPTIERSSEGPGTETIQVLTTEADSVSDAENEIDQSISQTFDDSKLKVLVVGKELAKGNVYQVLDEFYRDPKSNLNAMLALADGTAEDVISINNRNDIRVSKYISGLLEATREATLSPGENIQLICAELFEPGLDFALPMIKPIPEKQLLKFSGLALFHEKSFTEVVIKPHRATLFNLLNGKKGKVARFTREFTDTEDKMMGRVSFDVMRSQRDLKLKMKNGELVALLDLKLKVRIVEYPDNHLNDNKKVEKINDHLSDTLTKNAEEIIELMQEANSDIYGIGRKAKAYHTDFYKNVEWKEYYPSMTIKPNVTVEILQYGVIN